MALATAPDELQPDELRPNVVSARVPVLARVVAVWRYRELLVAMTRKELKVKYKDSVLGFIWSMLNPALTLVVYYVVFQMILRNGIPLYAIWILCGLLVWNMFLAATAGACSSVVANGALVKKVAFPREILPLASIGAALVHFTLQMGVLVVALVAFRHNVAWLYVPALVPALGGLLLFTVAFSLVLAAVDVPMRDTQHMLEIVLMLWFWLTPIVYQYQLVAEKLAAHHLPQWLFAINPVTPVVLTFQRAIYGKTSVPGPHGGPPIQLLPQSPWYLWGVLILIVVSIGLIGLALKLFGRYEASFAEEL